MFSLSDRYCCTLFSQISKLRLRESQFNCSESISNKCYGDNLTINPCNAKLCIPSPAWKSEQWVRVLALQSSASSFTLVRCRALGKLLDLMIATFLEEFHEDSLRLSMWRALGHKECVSYWKSVLSSHSVILQQMVRCFAAATRQEPSFHPPMTSVKPCLLWSLDLCLLPQSELDLQPLLYLASTFWMAG